MSQQSGSDSVKPARAIDDVWLIPITGTLREILSENWSDPIQIRIDGNGEFIFRELRHPVMGTEQDPLDRIWLTID